MRDNWNDDRELLRRNVLLLEDELVQELFNGYYFDSEDAAK